MTTLRQVAKEVIDSYDDVAMKSYEDQDTSAALLRAAEAIDALRTALIQPDQTLELLKEALEQLEEDWYKIEGEWGKSRDLEEVIAENDPKSDSFAHFIQIIRSFIAEVENKE